MYPDVFSDPWLKICLTANNGDKASWYEAEL